MTGKDLDNEMISKISEIIGVEKSKIKVMSFDDIKFYLTTLTTKISSLGDFEDESEIDYSTGLEILESLNNLK
jgi:hypothetical protein